MEPPATRRLWSPPRLRSAEASDAERHATWTELFYDLVFVVAIAELAHLLKDHPTAAGVGGFALLFVPIWWSWTGVTFYLDRFDVDDFGNRILMAVQMLAAAALAVNVHEGLGRASAAFAASYVA